MHDLRVFVFEITRATSKNSFSKTTKWFLMFFCAKWRRGLACFVPFLYWSLLFSWKRRKPPTEVKKCVLSRYFLQKWCLVLSSNVSKKCLKNYSKFQKKMFNILKITTKMVGIFLPKFLTFCKNILNNCVYILCWRI